MNIQYLFAITIIALLCSGCAGSVPPGHARASGFFSKKILIQSAEGLFVRIDNSKNAELIADAPTEAEADTFYFCDLGNDVLGLQAMNGLYIAVHLGHKNQMVVHQIEILDWERLIFYTDEKGTVFRAANNYRYILPDNTNGKILTAMGTTVENPLCYFKVIKIS